jgi:hypothetical protein
LGVYIITYRDEGHLGALFSVPANGAFLVGLQRSQLWFHYKETSPFVKIKKS